MKREVVCDVCYLNISIQSVMPSVLFDEKHEKEGLEARVLIVCDKITGRKLYRWGSISG